MSIIKNNIYIFCINFLGQGSCFAGYPAVNQFYHHHLEAGLEAGQPEQDLYIEV